jgi:hypothetical protein
MIRKLALPATIVAAFLGVTGVAQAATNHTAGWSVTPAKVGTKAAPKPTAIKQVFDVTTDDGTRPEITSDYSLAFQGIHQNKKYFAHCSKQKILNGGQAACRSAKVGSGIVDNLAGLSSDKTSKIPCRLALNLYNGATNHLILVVNGGPNVAVNGPGGTKTCPLSVSDTPIDATFANSSRGATIKFHVDEIPLQHPQGGVDNALVHVETNLTKTTKTVRVRQGGRTVTKRVGYVESFNRPSSGKLALVAKFTAAGTGATATATGFASVR